MSSKYNGVCGVAEQLTPWIRAADSNSGNDVYASTVVLPGAQQRGSAVVKVFPPNSRKQRVFNEVVAHQLAKQCGLPSPFTFPCACHVTLLRRGTLERMSIDIDSTYILGVASIERKQQTIQQAGGDYAAKWADLMNWPHIAILAVFDELLGNDDRHISNLIRCGPQDYSPIDNERILFGEQWFENDLDEFISRRCDANIIADSIAECSDEVMRRRMIEVAQRFVMHLNLRAPENSISLERLCDAPTGTTDRLIAMLNKRRSNLQSLMLWHLRKGELFRMSSN